MTIKKQKVSADGSVVSVEYPTLNKRVSLDLDDLDDDMRFAFMVHGAQQKLGDAASGKPPEEKYEMASRIIESVLAGKWNLDAERDTSTSIIAAVAELLGVDRAEVEAAVNTKPEKIDEWRKSAKVKAKVSEMRAAKLAALAEGSDDPEVTL